MDGRERAFVLYKQFLQNDSIRRFDDDKPETFTGNWHEVGYESEIYQSEDTRGRAKTSDTRNAFAYPLVDIHNHPRPDLYPSYKDLESTSSTRKRYQDNANVDIRLISCITSPISLLGHHALLMYQEKTPEPVPDNKVREVTYDIIGNFRRFVNLFSMPCRAAGMSTKATQRFSEKLGRTRIGAMLSEYLAIDKVLESTGLYNAYMTFFDERTGLHIPEGDLVKFSFETDISNMKF